MKETLTAGEIQAIVSVLTINKDSADLMQKRGVDPFDVLLMGSLAIKYLESLPVKKKTRSK